jgi:hypothetical protein
MGDIDTDERTIKYENAQCIQLQALLKGVMNVQVS